MLNDPLANVLSKILNAEKRGQQECIVSPSSKTIKKVLDIMNEKGFIGTYEEVEDNKGGLLKVYLIGKLNKCNVIKPRYSVKKEEFEKYEKRYLPAKDFGYLIVSTPFGIMIHNQAKEKNTGGILLAYCY
jgi:small subunit ribosomal protein S8